MATEDEIEPHRIISEYDIFEVRFNITQSGSNKLLYVAAVNIVGRCRSDESEIYRAAEESARSWGAFSDPETPMVIDHHFYDRDFNPLSIRVTGHVDGLMKSGLELLSNTDLKRNYD